MLHLIVKIFQTIVDIFYYIFVISFRIGNLIYNLIKLFAYFVFAVFEGIGRLLVILYEDYATFFHDVNCKLETLFAGINYVIEMVLKSTCDAGSAILKQFTFVFTTGSIKISNVGEILAQIGGWVFLNMKAILILIGNGCWFLITLMPNFILYLLHLIGIILNYLFQRSILLLISSYKVLCHGLIVIINYFADIPSKSAIGLILVILIYKNFFMISPILYLIGRVTLNLCRRTTRRVIQWVNPRFNTLMNRIMQVRLVNLIGLFSLTLRESNIEENPDGDIYQTPPRQNGKIPPGHQTSSGKKLLCVICQDHEKCILLLPCRHLCVCNECSQKSRYYNDRCPICRKSINEKVRIYV